jgi:hypothetical protein
MSKELFDSLKGAIETIPDKLVSYPNMPVDTALQEAEDLIVWCVPDAEKLVKAGLNWKLVEDLPARAGALRYIQSQWQREFKSLEDVQKEWGARSPEAYELRDELLHHFYHAFYRLPDLYGRTQKIAEGSTHADMIQDLSDLAALGKANTEPLKAVSVDLSLLDKAESMSTEMAKLLAKANGKKLEDNKLRLLRDKAYTFMKESVDEIRRVGQYAFWKDDQRYKGYVSQFYKRQSARAAASKAEKTENAVN